MNGIIFLSALLPMALAADGKTKKGGQLWSDDDGDGVHDLFDLCDGSDDSVDLDGNGTPDCSESFFSTGMFNDSAEVSGWSAPNSVPSWDPTDAAAWSGSGSADISNSTWVSTEYMLSPCVAVSGGVAHMLLLNVDADNGSGSPLVGVQVAEYAGAGCSSSSSKITTVDTLTSNTSGFDIMGAKHTMQKTTQAVRLVIYNTRATGVSSNTDVLIDNVLLHDQVLTGTGATGTSKH